MKDSKGREYDGWVVRRSNGTLNLCYFRKTKAEILDYFQHVNETRREVRARLRRWGFTFVKVRLVEVVE